MRYLLVLALLSTVPTGPLAAQSSCGIMPIKPIPPIGCKDLVAQCVCDEHGGHCHYVWVCVK